MAGFSGFTVGTVNNRSTMIPLTEITKSSRKIEAHARAWQRLIAATGQPSFLNDEENVGMNSNDKEDFKGF